MDTAWRHWHRRLQADDTAGHWKRDLTILTVLVAAVVAIAAAAPSQTYAYSQLRWIGVMLATGHEGGWLLPQNHFGEVPHKPQLYFWLNGPLLHATGWYNDFLFCLPTILASVATAWMVYALGRRWFGRRCGLLAGALWVAGLHMSKVMYICTTDMLLTAWITASILCVDRLLFHRAPRGRRRRWVVGLWVTMILGAMSKGWGIVNPVLVGGFVALATAVWGGFASRGSTSRWAALTGAIRLVLHRWRKAARRVRLGWGLAAMAAVLVPLWAAMFSIGGKQFREVIRHEIVLRVAGGDEDAPNPSTTPPVLHLLYRALPSSALALGAFLLVPLGRWLSRREALLLPLCWILAVVVPFSIPHGFRPDYLLPCYAAVALLGAWTVETVRRAGPAGPRVVRVLRHGIAAVAVGASAAVAGGVGIALSGPWLSTASRWAMQMPAPLPSGTHIVLGVLGVLGIVGVVAAVRASLAWRVGRVAVVAVVAMLGVAFVRMNVFSRHAATRDGEKMIAFARAVEKELGDDAFCVYRAEKIATEVYLGRFGGRVAPRTPWGEPLPDLVGLLNKRREKWLITCDRGLVEFGATRVEQHDGEKTEVHMPTDLGRVRLVAPAIFSEGWGRMYLIRVHRPVHVGGVPRWSAYRSGKRGRYD